MNLEVDLIRTDGGTQPRAELCEDAIKEYAEHMIAGVTFPPITVFCDGQCYWLADGYHRLEATRSAFPGQPILADVHRGTQEDAQWFSYGVNKSHGLRRSNEDKERAVRAALQHPKSEGLSNYQIAAHCGVSEITVRRYRIRLVTTTTLSRSEPNSDQQPTTTLSRSTDLTIECCSTEGQTISTGIPHDGTPAASDLQSEGVPSAPSVSDRPRTGRDGRTIKTARIGKHSRHPTRSAAEVLAARRTGQRVRPTDRVKLELPNNNIHNCAYELLEYFTFEYLEQVYVEIVNLHQQRFSQEYAS